MRRWVDSSTHYWHGAESVIIASHAKNRWQEACRRAASLSVRHQCGQTTCACIMTSRLTVSMESAPDSCWRHCLILSYVSSVFDTLNCSWRREKHQLITSVMQSLWRRRVAWISETDAEIYSRLSSAQRWWCTRWRSIKSTAFLVYKMNSICQNAAVDWKRNGRTAINSEYL